MAIEITKVVNATTKKAVENNGYTVKKDEQKNTFTISSKDEIETATLQFTLKDATHEYVIGKGKLSTDKKSITELNIIKKTQLNFEGTLQIKGRAESKVAQINVKIGNMNPDNDWIIDMSNRVEKESSSLDVTSLIEWIQDKGADAELALPPSEEGESNDEISGLIIEFNALKFNLSKKEYNISFQSQKDAKLKFLGKFELSNVKFTLTNMDIPEETKNTPAS